LRWGGALRQDFYTRQNVWVIAKIERVLRGDINESCVRELDSGLEIIESSELHSFHAVALMYEKAATFLVRNTLSLCHYLRFNISWLLIVPCQIAYHYKIRMCHKSGFLLPNGWVEMYLLQDSRLSPMHVHNFPPTLSQGRRKALLSLIRSFCRLVHRIETAPDYCHKYSGKPGPWQRIVRRNVDFLLICLLNASSWQREVSFEYATTLSFVKKVLRLALYRHGARPSTERNNGS
jgi:hypothetical protein